MGQMNFGPGMRILFDLREYLIEERAPHQSWKLQDVILETRREVTERELVEAYFGQRLSIINEPALVRAIPRKTPKRIDFDFTQLREEVQVEAYRREAYVIAAKGIPLGAGNNKALDRVIILIADQLNDDKPPSSITLYRWRRDWFAHHCDIRALVDAAGKGNTNERLTQPEVRDILVEEISSYATPNQPTIHSIYKKVKDRIDTQNDVRAAEGKVLLRCPARSTVYDHVGRIRKKFAKNITQGRSGTLEPFQWQTDGAKREFRSFLKSVDIRLPFEERAFLGSVDTAARLFYSCGGILRPLMKIIRRASRLAIDRGAGRLELKFLEQAFDVLNRGP